MDTNIEASGDLLMTVVNYFINDPVRKNLDLELLKMQEKLDEMQKRAKEVLSSKRISGPAFRLLRLITIPYEESVYYSLAVEVFKSIN